MNRKPLKAFLLLTVTLLVSCGNNPAPEEPLRYGPYTIKEGVTDLSFLEGYPWINTSVVGVLGKIEKPSVKDDFYAFSSYDAFANGVLPEGVDQAGGFYDDQTKKNTENRDKLFQDKNNELAGICQSLIKGSKDAVKAQIEGILSCSEAELRRKFASSEVFEGLSNLIHIQNSASSDDIGLAFPENRAIMTVPFLMKLSYNNPQDRLKKDLLTMARAEGLNADVKAAIDDGVDSFAAMFPPLAKLDSEVSNETTVGELDQVFNGAFNVKSALKSLGLTDEKPVTYSDYILAFAKGFDALFEAGRYDTLRHILAIFKISDGSLLIGVDNYRKDISGKIDALGRLTANTPEFSPEDTDLDVARLIVEKVYPEAVKRCYIDTFITPESRAKVTHLVNDIVTEYERVFDDTKWLSEETIDKAIEKLHAMTYTVFYDDAYVSVFPFAVNGGETTLSAFDRYQKYVTANLATGVMTNDEIGAEAIDTFNAFYVPQRNSFGLYHGFCSSYIDNPELTKEMLYGRMGFIIGHEITHGFDSTGSLYDKKGKKQEWWSPTDREKFDEKVSKLVTFVDTKCRLFNDIPNNGANMAGEMIADMGGFRIVTRLAEKDEKFDFESLYSNYNYTLAMMVEETNARTLVTYDPHPLPHFRVNFTLAQFERFQKTFGLKEGDGMYLAPNQSLAIW